MAEALGTGDSDALSWRTREALEANGGGRAYPTIRRETLARLGVPHEKQHVLEVHRCAVYPRSGKLPRLTGRIAVVDDVHEGKTAQTLACVCDADVIDVGQSLYTGMARILPVCTITDDEVLKEVYRPRAGHSG